MKTVAMEMKTVSTVTEAVTVEIKIISMEMESVIMEMKPVSIMTGITVMEMKAVTVEMKLVSMEIKPVSMTLEVITVVFFLAMHIKIDKYELFIT